MAKFGFNKETAGMVKSRYQSAKSGSLLSDLIFPVKPKDESSPESYDVFNKNIVAFYNAGGRQFTPDVVRQSDSGRINWTGSSSQLADNTATTGCGWLTDDPTVLGFQLRISNQDPLFYLRNDKTSETKDDTPSAMEYLINNKQTDRYLALRRFAKKINYLFQVRDYYLQRLSGLGNIYEHKDGVSYIEREIKIDTLESIDLFVSSIADDYNKATYDYNNMKSVIPVNLLYFDLIIIVNEIRQFKTFLQTLRGENLDLDEDADGLSYLNRHLGCYVLKFSDCLFDFTESNNYLNALDNTAPNPIANSFKIKLGRLDFSEFSLEPFSELTHQHYEEGTLSIPYDKAKLGNLRRFTREKMQPRKSFLGKIVSGDWKGAMNDAAREGKKVGQSIARELDKKIQNSAGLIEGKVINSAGQIVQKYNPVNLISRMIIHGQNFDGTHVWGLDKWESQFNRRTADTIDNITDTILLKKRTAVNADTYDRVKKATAYNDKIKKDSSKQSGGNGHSGVPDSELSELTRSNSVNAKQESSAALRRKICEMIVYGKSEEEYLSDVLRSTIGKKGIN